MKTSKKILIAFLSVFCLSLLSVMITVDEPKSDYDFEEVEEKLPDIKIVKVCKGANITLNTKASSNIKYSHEKGALKEVPYQIVEDTLILKPLVSGNLKLYYTVSLKQINKLINAGGQVDINIQQDTIEVINKQKGYLRFTKKSSIAYLSLNTQEKSRSQINSKQIKSLDAQVNNANLSSNSEIPLVNLQAKHNASIRLQHVRKLIAVCDSTSIYRVY